MNTIEKAEMYDRIRAHGQQLLAIFPDAREQDPIKLYKALRRWEGQASLAAEDFRNGATESDEYDRIKCRIHKAVNNYLSADGWPCADDRVCINSDPRDYALKIHLHPGEGPSRQLHRDWGVYGIVAPDLTTT